MGQRLREDGQHGTLESTLSSGATTWSDVGIANLPTVVSGAGDIVAVTLDPDRTAGEPEIIHVTVHAAAATTATIARAQEGTTARSHAAGVKWAHGPTVTDFEETTKLRINAEGSSANALEIYARTDADFADRLRVAVESNAPAIGSAVTGITGDAGTNTFTKTSHGLADGQAGKFTSLTGGSGLSAATVYYVRSDVAANTFTVATSPGGSAVALGSTVTDCTWTSYDYNVDIDFRNAVLEVGNHEGSTSGPGTQMRMFKPPRDTSNHVTMYQPGSNSAVAFRVGSAGAVVIGAGGYSSTAFQVETPGDTQPKYRIGETGTVSWGAGGSSALDTVLSRSGAAALDLTGSLDADGLSIAGAAVATQAYADSVGSGQLWKESCACATTANITLSGEQTIDGVTTSASRVLVKNQTTASGNGIYVSAAGAWSRATDADSTAELDRGASVFVSGGTTNANTTWVQTTDDPTVGSSSIVWVQTNAGSVSAGTGLTKSGNTISVSTSGITNSLMADDAIGIAELSATGTASSSTFLRGDNVWATPSTGSGLGGIYSVDQYGAVGDGVTDDTTAISDTRTAAGTGGVVYFPPGTYLVSGSSGAAASTASQRWELHPAATIKQASSANPVITISAADVTIYSANNGVIDGSATGLSAGRGIVVTSTGDRARINGVKIIAVGDDAINTVGADGVIVENCWILNSYKNGIYGQVSSADVDRLTIRNNLVDRSGISASTAEGSAIKVHGDKWAYEKQTVTIGGSPTGGTFTLTYSGQTTSAIAYDASAATVQAALEALSNIAVGDVYVTLSGAVYTVSWHGTFEPPSGSNPAQMTASAAGLTGGTSPSVTVATSTAFDSTYYTENNVSIVGNHCIMPVSPTTGGTITIETWGNVGRAIIANNRCINGAMGISIDWSNGTTCVGNNIYGPNGGVTGGGVGIEVAGSSYVTVANNVINGANLTGEQAIAVWDAGSYWPSVGCTVSGNTIQNLASNCYGVVVQTSVEALAMHTTDGGKNHTVVGNTIEVNGSSAHAVRILRSPDVIVANNVLNGMLTAERGIYLSSAGNCAITGNLIKNLATSGTRSAIHLVDTTTTIDNVAITGNVFYAVNKTVTKGSSTTFGSNILFSGNSGDTAENNNATDTTRSPAAKWTVWDMNLYVIDAVGSGAPAIFAGIGSTYRRTDAASASTVWYTKSSAVSSSSGWTASTVP